MSVVRLFRKIQRYLQIKKDPIAFARSIGVSIGEDCRLLGVDDKTFGSEPYLITIGNRVTITDCVRFVTHDGGVWIFRDREKDIELFRPITVGSNVFIGLRSIILPGISIGSNVVIGAGSVVVTDIPNNSVAAGVPAKVLRATKEYRDKIEPFVVLRSWHTEEEKRNVLVERFGVPGNRHFQSYGK